MKAYLNDLFGLDIRRSIWIEQKDLCTDKAIVLNHKRHIVVMPRQIEKSIIVRYKGLGKTRNNKTGDLLLHIWLNKGDDIRGSLWLSETAAKDGANKRLTLGEKKITMVIPPHSHHGLTIRLNGYGKELDMSWGCLFIDRKRGDALIKLFVYPDRIMPNYGSFQTFSTEDMVLEGWVYRKIDEVISKMGKSAFPADTIGADVVADLFNEGDWTRIFYALVRHLQLSHIKLELKRSSAMSSAGSCQKIMSLRNNVPVIDHYEITIKDEFLDNPFSIAAILAHELCHVLYSEKIHAEPLTAGYVYTSEKATLEEEHTVDLLAFMFKIGEFQLRVARDKRLTLGYFNQQIFERMQVIVTKKLNSSSSEQ